MLQDYYEKHNLEMKPYEYYLAEFQNVNPEGVTSRLRVENPWPGKSVKVSYEYGRPDEVHFGEYLNIELYKEEHAELFRI